MKLIKSIGSSILVIIRFLFIFICLAGGNNLAQNQPGNGVKANHQTEGQAALNETEAGKLFTGWLDAVNSGQREILQKFIAANFEPPPDGNLPVEGIANRHFGLYQKSKGFLVRKIGENSAEKITVVLEAKRTGFGTIVTMLIKSIGSSILVIIPFLAIRITPEN